MVHRVFALVVLGLLLALAWRLWQDRRHALAAGAAAPAWPVWALVGLSAAQLASGLSNVVLGWPLVAALAHSAGAAALVGVTTALCVVTSRSARAASQDARAPDVTPGAPHRSAMAGRAGTVA
jgi:cytochrome c oxidase assembly protein subunit 15